MSKRRRPPLIDEQVAMRAAKEKKLQAMRYKKASKAAKKVAKQKSKLKARENRAMRKADREAGHAHKKGWW